MSKAKIILNENQKKAVQHKKGPLLVIAGAGTGKTRVITERIKYLIEKKDALPTDILGVTFTQKASSEMLARLDTVMPLGYEEPWINTFHSFADRILRAEGLEIGLNPSYKIMSYPQQWLLIRQNLFDFDLSYFRPLGNPTKFISAILKFISRLQDENILPNDFEEFAKNFKGEKEEKARWLELSSAYKKYEELKLQNSKMDFGDLITWTIRLFLERPNILKKYKTQFKHVLVDEFQDTNYAQYELIKLLCPKSELQKSESQRSLLVVGDDSQSIYKFRGAAVSNILEFKKDYPKSKMITLLQNYRSTQEILDPAYSLIQNNNPDTLESKLNISKELKSMVKPGTSGEAPFVGLTQTIEDEVEFVVSKIIEILGKEPEYTYKDFAILARANSHLDPFVFALRKYGLPYQLVGNRGLYDREEVLDIIAFLKVIVNPSDSISLYRVLNIKSLNIAPVVISKILTESKFKKLSMWEILHIAKETNDAVKSLCVLVEKFQTSITNKTPTDFVHELVLSINYLDQFIKEETVENNLSIKNLNLLLDKIKSFEVDYRGDTNEIPTVVGFLDYLEFMLEAGENPAQAEIEDVDTVNLLTVHSSKGLEFPVVFMVNLVSGRFPTRNRSDLIQIPDELVKEELPSKDPHLQEERRLFYVGMTRAQKYLYMVGAKTYGGKREKTLSGYINETKIDPADIIIDKQNAKQESLFGVNSSFRDAKLRKLESKGHTPYSLSFSKISTFKTCPLKYKYQYILNIPTKPNHALSFGITIHDTLRDFHSNMLANKDVSLSDLYKIYEDNWQPFGYLDAGHRKTRFESGRELLKKYYEKNAVTSVKPLAIEKGFNIKIGGIKFFGRIDRVDALEDGGVEIIDYKTGGVKTQKQVDADDQVAFYAIAAKEALGMDPKKLTYYYVEDDKKISTTRTDKDLETKRNEVIETIELMKKGNFKATPGFQCSWCDFKEICPFAYKN